MNPSGKRRSRGSPLPVLAVALLFLLPACSDLPLGSGNDRDTVGGVDLNALFAPPTPAERAEIERDWAARDPRAVEVHEEWDQAAEIGGEGARVRVVSHLVDGVQHVGAILQPAEIPPDPIPVLVYAHGGDQGVSLEEVLLIATSLRLAAGDYVVVVPSFRSESFRAGPRSWSSEGAASVWDGDVDDALALLDVALSTIPFADGERIGAVGFSRGGTVALLMAIRDPRIAGVVSFFGPTDFFGPFVQEVFRASLLGDPPRLPGVPFLIAEILEPLQTSEMGVDEARLELLTRSPAHFADRIPAVQVHHGTADDIVPVEEALQLALAMEELGRGEPEFQLHLYPGAGHSPLGMPQSGPLALEFLSTFVERRP